MSIWEAVEREDLDAIENYARNGGDLEAGATRRGRTPLLHALVLKKKKSFSKLLSLRANPNTICRGGDGILLPHSSVIHHTALEQDPFWLKAALESGGNPNQMNNAKGLQKGRPLYFAIMYPCRIENVKLLCEHGADVNAPIDELGLTALFNVCGNFEIVHYLLECGADPAEPRPVHERNTFIHQMRQMKPELYDELKLFPNNKEWCTAVWDWLRSHGKDPEKAKWNGSKWIWDGEN